MGEFKPKRGSGDLGYTDIFLKRVPKTHLVIKLNALLDELGAVIGVLRSGNKKLNKELLDIQKGLIALSSFLAGYGKKEEVARLTLGLEKAVSSGSVNFKIKKFAVFGEDGFSARLNLIRAKTRICEIMAWQAKSAPAARYLNRLSDYLFLLSVR